jgi:hypothetical protein
MQESWFISYAGNRFSSLIYLKTGGNIAWIQQIPAVGLPGNGPAIQLVCLTSAGAFSMWRGGGDLPHLYGAVNWALMDDAKKLPLKVSDIYRRLAT